MQNKTVHMLAFGLLVVGGLNWLLIGLFDWGIGMVTDPISPLLTRAVYILVGLSAIYAIVTHKSSCSMCVSEREVGRGAGSMGGL